MPPKTRKKTKEEIERDENERRQREMLERELREKAADEQRLRAQEEEARREAAMKARRELEEAENLRRQAERERLQRLETERKQREREREIQQLQILEEKDQEIDDLKKKIFGLHRSFQESRADLEREQQHAFDVQNQLDAARLRVVELEEAIAQDSDGRQAETVRLTSELANSTAREQALESELSQTRTAAEESERDLQGKMQELTTQLAAARLEHEKATVDTQVMLKMLTGELERHRTHAGELQKEVERRERDEIKTTIMLGLLRTQLGEANDAKAHAEAAVGSLKSRMEADQKAADALAARVEAFDRDRVAAEQASNAALAAATSDVERANAACAAATTTGERLGRELAALTEKHAALEASSAAKERELFETVVKERAAGEQLAAEVQRVKEEAERKDRDTFETVTKLQGELDARNARANHLAAQLERTESEAFQAAATSRSEKDVLMARVDALERELKETQRAGYERETDLRGELDQQRATAESTARLAKAREDDAFQREARAKAEIQALQAQVAAQREENATQQRNFVAQTVALHAEREAAKGRALVAEADAQRQAATSHRETQNLTASLTVEKATRQEEVDRLRNELETMRAARDDVSSALNEATQRVSALEATSQRKERETWDSIAAYKAEVASLRKEKDAYAESVARLESSVSESYNYKLLAEQNDQLRSDVEAYKLQIKNLQSAVASMKVEADILDGYKARVVAESHDVTARRASELERMNRLVAPLVSEMAALLQRHGLLNAGIAADVDQYRLQAAAVGGAAATTTAADTNGGNAHTLPKLSPLPRPGSGGRHMNVAKSQ